MPILWARVLISSWRALGSIHDSQLKIAAPDTSSTTALLQQLPLAMALPPTKYARGSATEHSETIIDASGPATEHSEEGRPPRIPITEVAFGKGMWSSSNGQLRFHARGMLPSRHCYRAAGFATE